MDVIAWLLDSDPAIRWQVLRDLTDAAPEEVAAERVRVAREGWGARLLDRQGADGMWEGGACFPGGRAFFDDPANRDLQGQPWNSTYWVLVELVTLGVDPGDPRVRAAIEGVRAGCFWEHDLQPFFEGEVEPCINGQTLLINSYFGEPGAAIAELLLGEQLADGGWNCDVERGSVRSSFHTTICVLEGLLAFEQATASSPEVTAARRRAHEYLLERHLLRRRSTGELIDPLWSLLAFPPRWRHDVLRTLDYFRAAGEPVDARMGEALEILRGKRQPDGTWLLEYTPPGAVQFTMEDVGKPSRWNTLRALRVLQWADGLVES